MLKYSGVKKIHYKKNNQWNKDRKRIMDWVRLAKIPLNSFDFKTENLRANNEWVTRLA